MTHSSLQPLAVLLEQAERDRDDALSRQRQHEGRLGAARQQETQLREYRSEYQNRWNQQFRAGVTMTLMHCYQEFVGRLHGAVDLQGQQVERLGKEHDRLKAEVLAAELRVASVRKLIERRELALLRSAERRDQKQQDEFAARSAWNRANSQQAAGL
ncbi:flagellar FliJ protein [Sphaerotilus hippei]|uniref:Flagellar FliJ protein n=1 Tax=Sphaerotilus hippei TaxID=744406 RepID=A0A318GYE5_9BURK|nr:flagellar export protein FliJ [Sphaerotilus hippei]PXW91938.1 flagellar FliJ protein [Sphaerotilus hippei]